MAKETIGYGREGKALLPLKYVMGMFHTQLISQLQANMQTQHIFPYEVYPGYHSINEYRRQHGGWYSKSEGAHSFEGEVLEADENTGMVTMTLRYNDYMQYVDIGTMAGVHAEDVNRSKKAQFKTRYVNRWNPSGGASHRPGIQPEWNHLKTRVEGYLQRYYDAKIDLKILETFEGQPWSFKIL